jgi:6,7-dimethyl-8-ribityllumazine synthase
MLNIAIIVARFNPEITERLLSGAQEALRGVATTTVLHVPGAFEIPFAAKQAALTKRFDAIVTLGCVIRGETAHFEYISNAATLGISQVGLETGVPVAFGVLTTETDEQAMARSVAGPDNKGFHAAQSAVEMVQVLRSLK